MKVIPSHHFLHRRAMRSLGASSIILASLVILLASPNAAIDYMKKGLSLCATGVIPSLFPFMIISELAVSSGIGQRIASLLSPVTRKIFGTGEAGACAFILGTVCGFPVGAGCAAKMYDRGDISRRELERILTFCNNPSPAFVIATVGTVILKSRHAGILIYVCLVISSVAIGILSRVLFSDVKDTPPKKDRACEITLDASIFTSAVKGSAISMLTVCAYVVFFTTIVGCIGALIESFAPDIVSTLLCGFFELSSGASRAAELGGRLSVIAAALFAGWSGLGVHFQIMSVTSGRGISYKPYLIAKAAHGILCSALVALFTSLFPSVLTLDAGVTVPVIDNVSGIDRGGLICIAFFVAALCPIIVGFLSKKAAKPQKMRLTNSRACVKIHCNIETR